MNKIRTFMNRGIDAVTNVLVEALPYLELVLPERALALLKKLVDDEPEVAD